VPDSPLLYPDLTVREHLELVGLAHGVGDGVDGRVTDLLELFGLTARGDVLPGQLSRGMRQKTRLACALVRPFLLILLDEPVVGLDRIMTASVRGELGPTADSLVVADEITPADTLTGSGGQAHQQAERPGPRTGAGPRCRPS
jgi:ABC-type multidrug transport system ATPase subunit